MILPLPQILTKSRSIGTVDEVKNPHAKAETGEYAEAYGARDTGPR